MGYETGNYFRGLFECFRVNANAPLPALDTIRNAIDGVGGALLAGGWTETGAIPAWGYIKIPNGAPALDPTATTPQAPIYYVGIVSSSDQGLRSYFFVDLAHPPTDAQWQNALLYTTQIGEIVKVPLGASPSDSLINLMGALKGWNGTVSGSGAGQRINLVATFPGTAGDTKIPDMFLSSYWALPDIQPAGGGYSYQSQTLGNNVPINVNVIEQPSILANYTLQLQFTDFSLTYSMAQSGGYRIWASPVAFCIFEDRDIPVPIPPRFPAIPDINQSSRNVFVSQIYLDNSAYPTTTPMQLLICANTRQGLASTESASTSMVLTWTPEGVFTATSVTGINPIWACYVPRFAETAAKLGRVDGTPIAVDAQIGLTKATASAPSRIRGLLPDAFVLLADRDLDEQIKCGSKTWWAMRAGRSTVVSTNAPAGTLYMRVA